MRTEACERPLRHAVFLTPLAVTDNGAFADRSDTAGYVWHDDRTTYLAEHIAAVADAHAQGADVRGISPWSLLDNFEWAEGYTKRCRIVHVDYKTQTRTPEKRALWFRDTNTRSRTA